MRMRRGWFAGESRLCRVKVAIHENSLYFPSTWCAARSTEHIEMRFQQRWTEVQLHLAHKIGNAEAITVALEYIHKIRSELE